MKGHKINAFLCNLPKNKTQVSRKMIQLQLITLLISESIKYKRDDAKIINTVSVTVETFDLVPTNAGCVVYIHAVVANRPLRYASRPATELCSWFSFTFAPTELLNIQQFRLK